MLEERLDKPWREGIALMESASADMDMAPEASARFTAMLRGQRELVLLDQEYWSLAVRDPKLRARYAKRLASAPGAMGRAIAARMEQLGAPPLDEKPEQLAVAFIALGQGLAIQRLIDARAVPESILGDTFALIYAGHLARSGQTRNNQQ